MSDQGESKNRKNIGYLTSLEEKGISKGEEIIGTFNPNGNHRVESIKRKAIDLINEIEKLGIEPRRKNASYTQLELGTMMAIKSLFY